MPLKSIRASSNAIFAAMGLMALTGSAFIAWQLTKTNSEFKALINVDVAAVDNIQDAVRGFSEIRADIADLLVSNTDDGNKQAVAALAAHRKKVADGLATSATLRPQERTKLANLEARVADTIDRICGPSIQAGLAATAIEEVLTSQMLFLETCAPAFAPTIAAIDEVATRINGEVAAEKNALVQAAERAALWTPLVLVLAFALLIGAAIVLVSRKLVAPMKELEAAMRALATGDLTTTVPHTSRQDELGSMAGAVQVFKDNALRMRALEEQERALASERQRRSENMTEVVTEVSEIVRRAAAGDFSARLMIETPDPQLHQLVDGINEINVVVDDATSEFARTLQGVAAGDLTERVETDYRGKFGVLKNAVNETIDRLSETVQTIQTTSAQVESAALEINTGANDLSRRTENQAASLEETAATAEQLAASVKATSQASQQAAVIADEAMAKAESGGAIVGKAVEAMSRIETSSTRISDISRVIDEIAFQTNLLALNAAVEAARAGEAGKGFAVVASEVRTLAQRSAEAAKDIFSLISSSNAEVEDGVKLVRDAGEELSQILAFSRKVASTIADISSAASEQANGIEEMTQAVAQLDEMTQQNAALAEQSSASAGSLTDRISQLNALVAAFKTQRAGSIPAHGAAFAPARLQPAAKTATASNPGSAAFRAAPSARLRA